MCEHFNRYDSPQARIPLIRIASSESSFLFFRIANIFLKVRCFNIKKYMYTYYIPTTYLSSGLEFLDTHQLPYVNFYADILNNVMHCKVVNFSAAATLKSYDFCKNLLENILISFQIFPPSPSPIMF